MQVVSVIVKLGEISKIFRLICTETNGNSSADCWMFKKYNWKKNIENVKYQK